MAVTPPKCRLCGEAHWLRDGCQYSTAPLANGEEQKVARNELTDGALYEPQPSTEAVGPRPERKPKFDKKAWQRDYMREYRKGRRRTPTEGAER